MTSTLSPSDLATLRACVHLAIVDATVGHHWNKLAELSTLLAKLEVMSGDSDKTAEKEIRDGDW